MVKQVGAVNGKCPFCNNRSYTCNNCFGSFIFLMHTGCYCDEGEGDLVCTRCEGVLSEDGTSIIKDGETRILKRVHLTIVGGKENVRTFDS